MIKNIISVGDIEMVFPCSGVMVIESGFLKIYLLNSSIEVILLIFFNL